MDEEQQFRQNVAIVVVNDDGLVLVGNRIDRPGQWQLPQGGIEPDEPLELAMLRELREEIGTKDVQILGRLDRTFRYEWPENVRRWGYVGQEQYYFLVRILPTAVINLMGDGSEPPEFSEYRWVTLSEFLNSLNGLPSKDAAYRSALNELNEVFPGVFRDSLL